MAFQFENRCHGDKVLYPGDITLTNTHTALPDPIEKQLHAHLQFMENDYLGIK